jgi:hypothetical protein
MPPSEKAKDNHANIRRAVARASREMAKLKIAKAFSIRSHYQLGNRLAFAWKLASLGVPVCLVYLGFCGDHGIARVGDPIGAPEHWEAICHPYLCSALLFRGVDLRFEVRGTPAWVATRARFVLSQSPPVAV